MTKILLFGLNIFSILLAFMLGFMYERNMHVKELNEKISKRYIIELKQTKTKLEINNPYPNIEIELNGSPLSSSGVPLDY